MNGCLLQRSVACSPDPTALNPLMIGGGRGFNGNWETAAPDHHFPSAPSTMLLPFPPSPQ